MCLFSGGSPLASWTIFVISLVKGDRLSRLADPRDAFET